MAELSAAGPGDILVFLPGEREIRDTADALTGTANLEVLPLYSRLSAAEQHRVFSPTGSSRTRRVVLATNVAETSLTVPGIRYVVDTGVARISRYSVRTKVQRLPIEAISQASANQRSGRCGRVAAGIAIRLYSEEDFLGRPEFTEPEILRTNLASVILQMTSLGLGDLARFPFVEPPDRRNVSAGNQLLEELGAFAVPEPPAEEHRAGGAAPARSEGAPWPTTPSARPSLQGGQSHPRPAAPPPSAPAPRRGRRSAGAPEVAPAPRLTRIGSRLARLPIDPRLARMILEAERLGCTREVIVIAAALSLQDPRERPAEQQAQADQMHARFKDKGSDFLTWLNLWRHLKQQQRELSSSAFRRMCKREFLNYLRVREWQDFESQLRQVCKEMKVDVGRPADVPDADGIHQALLSGLLSHIGLLEERDKGGPGQKARGPREYLGARGARFAIFPGSALKGANPQFLMAGELVETSRLWARQNAAIQPEWAERLGAHLVKRTYSEPHWSRKRAAVMAYERVTLYGVPLVADRLISYGKVDRELSRELFIRHALVYGEWATRHRFYADNLRLLEEAEELEHRARRRDIVVDEHTLFDFYDARVGAEVVSGAHFDQWWKRERQKRPDLLTFDPSMLTHETAAEVRAQDYPELWHSDGLTFPIGYHFEPGAADDGLTIDVPVATLNRVEADQFSWNVPGLREELVTSLIRSLPKNLRVNFVPAPNKAREFLAAVPAGDEPLLTALARWFRSTTGVVVPEDAWDWNKVPEHLRPTFRVVDDSGREQGRGKDLEALKEPLRPRFAEAMASVAADSGMTVTGQTVVDLRHPREGVQHGPRRARGARVPGAGRRGPDRGAPGVRLRGRAGGPAPARRTPPAPARHPVAGEGDRGLLRQHREAGAGRVAVPLGRGAARRLRRRGAAAGGRRAAAGPVRAGVRRARGRRTHRPGGAGAGGAAGRVHRARRVAAHRQGAERAGRDGHAAGAVRHEGAAGPAGAARLRGGGGGRPAAADPDVPRRDRPPARASRPFDKLRTSGDRARPPADGPDLRAPVRLGAPDVRPPRGPAAGRGAAVGAVDARGVPRLALGPAPRHGVPGQRRPHPQSPPLTPRRPVRCGAPTRVLWPADPCVVARRAVCCGAPTRVLWRQRVCCRESPYAGRSPRLRWLGERTATPQADDAGSPLLRVDDRRRGPAAGLGGG